MSSQIQLHYLFLLSSSDHTFGIFNIFSINISKNKWKRSSTAIWLRKVCVDKARTCLSFSGITLATLRLSTYSIYHRWGCICIVSLIHLFYGADIEGDGVWHLETIPFHYIVAVNIIGRGNRSHYQTLIYAELQLFRKMNTTWCQTIYLKASIPILQCQLPLLMRKLVFKNTISMIMLSTCSNKLCVPLGL